MTRALFRDDAYLTDAPAQVVAHTPEGGIICDVSIFYPTGGGQPGDGGLLEWDGGHLTIATTLKGEALKDGASKDDVALGTATKSAGETAGETIVLVPAEPTQLPPIGTRVTQRLDWRLRHRHMRVHTALHLLSVVIPLPVTGGAIGADKGRLDFAMDAPPEDKQALEDALNRLIESDYRVSETWITQAELDAQPALVKTLSVQPPRGSGRIRLVRIGEEDSQIDLQPCGGTHVARTSEIGRVRIGKIEKKGRMNRRIAVHLD